MHVIFKLSLNNDIVYNIKDKILPDLQNLKLDNKSIKRATILSIYNYILLILWFIINSIAKLNSLTVIINSNSNILLLISL